MEAYLEINYELVFQRKEGHNFSYHVPKRPTILKQFSFDISKFKFQNRLKQKISGFGFFFLDKRVCRSQTPKKCANIIADSESFKRYGDFGT